MIFFRPDAQFISIIKAYAKQRSVIDCGAGECLFEKMYAATGGSVLSLELLPQDVDTPALMMDCKDFEFNHRTLPIFIRPCHNGFVHETILRHLHVVDSFLYVGLEKNLTVDLPGDCADGEGYVIKHLHPEWEGPEGERIYQIVPPDYDTEDTMRTFVLVEQLGAMSGRASRSWYEIVDGDRNKLWNMAGGYMPCDEEFNKILKETQATDFDDLNWTNTCIDMLGHETRAGAGWLSRSGQFYACARRNHTSYAELILKKTVRQLDDTGWVHIYGPPSAPTDAEAELPWHCDKTLSAEQRNWLSQNGYEIEDWD